MNTSALRILALAAVLLAPGLCAKATPEPMNDPSAENLKRVSAQKAIFTAPPGKIPSNSAVDAPLMGNGDTLVVLGGDAGRLRFHIGKNELWKMSVDNGSHPVPLARLDVAMPEMAGASYRVEQDLATAITTGIFTKDGKTLTVETGVAATENLLWARLSITGGEVGGTIDLIKPGAVSPVLNDTAKPPQIGREQHGGGRWYFDGEIADVQIAPDLLSGAMIPRTGAPRDFNGKSDWAEFPAPRMDKTVSVAAWIRIRSAHPEANYIVSKGEWNQAYSLGLSNGCLRWSIGGQFLQMDKPLPLNEWTHVVATFDGFAQRIFINGEQKMGPPAAPKAEAAEQTAAGDVLVVERHFDVGDPLPYRGSMNKITVPAGAACAARVVGAGRSFTVKPGQPVLLVAAVSGHYDRKDYPAAALQRATSFKAPDLDPVLAAHKNWWGQFWGKSFVEIPDKFLEQRYYLSHYGMACASRVKSFPPGLFGWTTTDAPDWSGDYHMNYNFVAPFYGLYAANHLEQALPCNEPIIDSLPEARKICVKETGVEGTFLYVGMGPLGSWAHRIALMQKSNSSYSCVPLASTWYATYDLDFARRAYPFVRDTARFWENWLKLEDGRYVIYKDAVHEGSGDDKNPILSLGLINLVMNLALDMSRELGVDADRRGKWADIRDRLSPFPLQERGGKTIFRYSEKGTAWWGDNTLGIQHIYPSGAIGLDSDPNLLEISRNTINALNRWVDYNGMNSFYVAAIRVSHDPATILAKLRDAQTRLGAANGMIKGNPHGMEHFSIVPNAIQEMLLQSHEGVLRFFPVWPKEMDARFGTLRARGAFLVSAELKNGILTGVKIISEKGRDCTVQNPWPGRKVKLVGRETIGGDRFSFKTKPGEVLELVVAP